MFDLAAKNTKTTSPDILRRRLMPNAIGYKTLVNVEIGLLYVWSKLRLENSTQNGNMKKNVLFSPLFLYNLALITHDATNSVNPSI